MRPYVNCISEYLKLLCLAVLMVLSFQNSSFAVPPSSDVEEEIVDFEDEEVVDEVVEDDISQDTAEDSEVIEEETDEEIESDDSGSSEDETEAVASELKSLLQSGRNWARVKLLANEYGEMSNADRGLCDYAMGMYYMNAKKRNYNKALGYFTAAKGAKRSPYKAKAEAVYTSCLIKAYGPLAGGVGFAILVLFILIIKRMRGSKIKQVNIDISDGPAKPDEKEVDDSSSNKAKTGSVEETDQIAPDKISAKPEQNNKLPENQEPDKPVESEVTPEKEELASETNVASEAGYESFAEIKDIFSPDEITKSSEPSEQNKVESAAEDESDKNAAEAHEAETSVIQSADSSDTSIAGSSGLTNEQKEAADLTETNPDLFSQPDVPESVTLETPQEEILDNTSLEADEQSDGHKPLSEESVPQTPEDDTGAESAPAETEPALVPEDDNKSETQSASDAVEVLEAGNTQEQNDSPTEVSGNSKEEEQKPLDLPPFRPQNAPEAEKAPKIASFRNALNQRSNDRQSLVDSNSGSNPYTAGDWTGKTVFDEEEQGKLRLQQAEELLKPKREISFNPEIDEIWERLSRKALQNKIELMTGVRSDADLPKAKIEAETKETDAKDEYEAKKPKIDTLQVEFEIGDLSLDLSEESMKEDLVGKLKMLAISDSELRTLLSLRDPANIPPLIEYVMTRPEPVRLALVARELGHYKDESVVETLGSLLYHSDERVVMGAILGLENTGLLSAVPLLCQMVRSDIPMLAQASRTALTHLGPVKVMAAMEKMPEIPDTKIKEACVVVLSRMRGTAVEKLLQRMLKDESEDVRCQAMLAMSYQKNPVYIDTLREFFRTASGRDKTLSRKAIVYLQSFAKRRS